uniref:Uncharacterized protein n=1 Tax=Plectus sambesii TaxID=2011161 RepID=A0A914UN30_9BILA
MPATVAYRRRAGDERTQSGVESVGPSVRRPSESIGQPIDERAVCSGGRHVRRAAFINSNRPRRHRFHRIPLAVSESPKARKTGSRRVGAASPLPLFPPYCPLQSFEEPPLLHFGDAEELPSSTHACETRTKRQTSGIQTLTHKPSLY